MAAQVCTSVVGQGHVETGRSHSSRNSRSRQDDKFQKMEAYRGLYSVLTSGYYMCLDTHTQSILPVVFCVFLNDKSSQAW